MTAPRPGDRARVTTFVAVDPLDAFEVFTEETDLWWRRGPKFRPSGKQVGVLAFEAGEGGRLFERFDDGEVFEVGRVLVWEPGARLVFTWRGRNFEPDQSRLAAEQVRPAGLRGLRPLRASLAECTEVEVRFTAKRDGTEVVLEHRGWTAIPDDAPVRHGLTGSDFTRMLGSWWGELITAYRETATR